MELDKLIQDHVEEKLQEISIPHLVSVVIRQKVTSEVSATINGIVKSQLEKLIRDEINSIFDGGEITTDDGYNPPIKYKNFEALMKKTLHDKLNNGYQIKRHVESAVKSAVESLYKDEHKAFSQVFKEFLEQKELLPKAQ